MPVSNADPPPAPPPTHKLAVLLWSVTHLETPWPELHGAQALFGCSLRGRRPPITLTPDLAPFTPLIKACWQQDPARRPDMATCANTLKDINPRHFPNVALPSWHAASKLSRPVSSPVGSPVGIPQEPRIDDSRPTLYDDSLSSKLDPCSLLDSLHGMNDHDTVKLGNSSVPFVQEDMLSTSPQHEGDHYTFKLGDINVPVATHDEENLP